MYIHAESVVYSYLATEQLHSKAFTHDVLYHVTTMCKYLVK